ncbi:cAMP-binding protein [Methylorubrum aminovorans]
MSAAPEALEALIRKLQSTSILTEEERQAIRRLPASIRLLVPGQDLVEDGERPAHCGLLVEGWSYRYKLLDEGRRQIISFHVAGDTPDLQSLHLGTLDHGVGALTPCAFALIPHENLKRLTSAFPDVAALLWRETLVDAGIFRTWITAMGRRSAYGRIAHLFCELYLRQEAVGLAADHRCPMPLRQTDLADATGLTTVHISRVLKALRDDNLITFERRQLLIHDWRRLYDAAEFDPAYLHLKSFER